MVNFNPFPFFRLRRRGRSRHPKAKNILDLPYTKYNQRTMLPDMLDHISLLSAFHKQRAVVHDFHQYCLSAANDFLDWASAQPYPSRPGTPVDSGTPATPATPRTPASPATSATPASHASSSSSGLLPDAPHIPTEADAGTDADAETDAEPDTEAETEADDKSPTEASVEDAAEDAAEDPARAPTPESESESAPAPIQIPAPKPPRFPAEWTRRPTHPDELIGLPHSIGAVMAWHACLLNPKLYDTEVEKYPGMIGKRFHVKAIAVVVAVVVVVVVVVVAGPVVVVAEVVAEVVIVAVVVVAIAVVVVVAVAVAVAFAVLITNAIRSGAIPVEPDPEFGDPGPYISRYYPSENDLPSATTFAINPEPDESDSDYDPDEHEYGEGPAYDLPTTFTEWDPLEIAAAIVRQMKFVDNMYRIGWLRAEFFGADFGEGARQLVRGCVRYHAWLDLHSSVSGAHFLVPTLDIDLAWHTHQLHSGVLEYVKSPDIWGTTGTAGTYKADNLKVLGWFLGHDDTAGEGKLGNGLEMTEKLWKEKFGWRYTY
ncbi:hypothetical protein EHS25_009248 [Saitozyma podzolica]|uniref:Uncharacterized protein n=1 Tax=Saitozyma podzolica TaxID=1890683 RepID=A0A427YL85_9TREE|nr:hypothetical protein EHS25_009248 [Saitozyma podzolica]